MAGSVGATRAAGPPIRCGSNPSSCSATSRKLSVCASTESITSPSTPATAPSTIAWYEDVLGLRPHARHDVPGEPIFLGPAGARLGLFAERPAGLRHIALATDAADARRLAARLDGLGIPYTPERHRDSDSIYFADPDGTTLEVMVRRP